MAEEESLQKQDGDVHDGDTGDYLFTIESAILPTSIDVLKDGYWYHYTLAGKMEDTETTETIPPEDVAHSDLNIDPLKDL